MLKKAMITTLAILISSGWAIADWEGEYYVASPSEIVDFVAQGQPAAPRDGAAESPVNLADVYPDGLYVPAPKRVEGTRPDNASKRLLADIATAFNFNVDTYANENEPVSQAYISANFTANKGPVYFQYTHSRNYSRMVDALFAEANSEFQGAVNNRFSVGVSFTPGDSNNMAVAGSGNTVSQVNASSVAYSAGD